MRDLHSISCTAGGELHTSDLNNNKYSLKFAHLPPLLQFLCSLPEKTEK